MRWLNLLNEVGENTKSAQTRSQVKVKYISARNASSGLGDNCQILAVRSDICECEQLLVRTTVSVDNCQCGQLSVRTTAIYHRLVIAGGGFFLLLDLGPGAAAFGMRIEINTGCSCYLSAARRRRGRFFLLLDLGPGAAACGMGIEINTGYSCYLSAARRRRGRFFSPIGSGPRGSGL